MSERQWRRAREKNPKLRTLEKQKIATVVGLGAIKYNDLSQNRVGDITFNWEKMLSFTGNSAPYLQYTYARLKSVLKKGRLSKFDAKLLSDAERHVVLKLSQFAYAVECSAENNLPSHLADYLYDLAQLTNHYYEVNPILRSEPKVRTLRLNLIKAVAETLKSGLNLLGIETLERM